MSTMPGTVTRTYTFAQMDVVWSVDPHARMKEYETAPDIPKLLSDAVANGWIGQEVADHVTDHWLNTYWPTADAQDVLQRGLYWAMRVAAFHDGDLTRRRAKALPIGCLWVCSGGKAHKKDPNNPKDKDFARFEVISVETDHQLTLLLLTPPPAKLPPEKAEGSLQRVWSTRRSEFGLDAGETKLEQWRTTCTVRPHDYEDYETPPH
jgi:hypothetical protein